MPAVDIAWSARRDRPPATDRLGFDPRLMSAERLLALAGNFPLMLGADPQGARWLDCAACGKGVVALTDWDGVRLSVTPMQLACATLRHQVMRHGLSLSGGTDG